MSKRQVFALLQDQMGWLEMNFDGSHRTNSVLSAGLLGSLQFISCITFGTVPNWSLLKHYKTIGERGWSTVMKGNGEGRKGGLFRTCGEAIINKFNIVSIFLSRLSDPHTHAYTEDLAWLFSTSPFEVVLWHPPRIQKPFNPPSNNESPINN